MDNCNTNVISRTLSWQPSASLKIIRTRAEMLARIRAFFATAEVLEVETPTCSVYANTDPAIQNLTTNYTGPNYPTGLLLYLHTSPEFAMKRLMAAGSGSIYQICRVYRNGELGTLHYPEFSMLEWYRLDFNYHRLMDEVVALIQAVSKRAVTCQRLTYAELFQTYLHINPHNTDIEQLRACALELGINSAKHLDLPSTDAWLDLLLTHGIQPYLSNDSMMLVYDYPATQSAGACIRKGAISIAERFELYLGKMEIANGYQELRDAAEQQQRFVTDLTIRQRQGLPLVPMDNDLLNAIKFGLPICAGVALGLDRLLMWLIGAQHIDQVLTFSCFKE